MSKSKEAEEELNELKKEYEELNEKCRELTMEELEQVSGGKVMPNNVATIILQAKLNDDFIVE